MAKVEKKKTEKNKKIVKKQAKAKTTSKKKTVSIKQPVVIKPPKKKKKIKIKYKNIALFLLLIAIVVFLNIWIFSWPIRNIIIKGNTFLTDQAIIETAQLQEYPSSMKNSTSMIEKKLKNNIFIQSAKVRKNGIREIIITVVENRPILYNSNTKKTVLLDGKEIEEQHSVPYLVNYVPDTIYKTFLTELGKINPSILERISEIQYNPNEVDTSRFFLTMNDGNYVYLTLPKFSSIDSYVEIIKNFNNKKGILYLDSGEYFQILEN